MSRRYLLTAVLVVSLAVPAGLAAQGLPASEGWHTVRPGDTLERLAADYLGAPGRWSEIAKLNPEVTDPNRLRPGQRLRVPLGPRAALPAARVQRLSRRVEAKPTPIDWSGAQLGDLLVERDGVRTFERSSAEMRFLDGTRLLVTEDSLVFLRRAGRDLAAQPVDAQSGRRVVEIIEGQADVERRTTPRPAAAERPAAPEVEIVVGGTRAVSRPAAGGALQTRARRAEAGSAKVMIYGGEGEVEAGGAKVALAEGTGSSVDAGRPPSPAEKLLPAPRPLDPAPGARRAAVRPSFVWEPVAGAASYVVEVCRDADCAQLLERAVDLAEPSWRPAHDLPLGEVHWRATARSASGLDGYPSTVAAVTLVAGGAPAVAALEPAGDLVRVGETLFAGPAIQLAPRVAGSPECGVERTVLLVDGGEAAAWPAAWPAGDHTAAVAVVDLCGNRTESAPLAFRVDTAAPVVRWEVSDAELLASHGEPRARLRSARATREGRRREENARPRARGIAWSADGRGWIPLGVGSGADSGSAAGNLEARIESSRPQVFLRGEGTLATADGELRLADGQLLRLFVEDDGSGVARLVVRWTPSEGAGSAPSGSGTLAIEAADLVGNTVRLEWPVTPGLAPPAGP